MTGVSVLIWRLEQEIEPGEIYCTIRNNVFGQAPDDGAAVSSGVDEAHMRRFVIENNLYCRSDGETLIGWERLLIRRTREKHIPRSSLRSINGRPDLIKTARFWTAACSMISQSWFGRGVFSPPYTRPSWAIPPGWRIVSEPLFHICFSGESMPLFSGGESLRSELPPSAAPLRR